MIIKCNKSGVKRMFNKELSEHALEFEYGFAETDDKTGAAFLGAHPEHLIKSNSKDRSDMMKAIEKEAAEAAEAENDEDIENSDEEE